MKFLELADVLYIRLPVRIRQIFEKVEKGMFFVLVLLLFVPLQGQAVGGSVVVGVT